MKIKELQKYLKNQNIDFALLTTRRDKKDFNINYFCQTECPEGALIIPKNKSPTLFVSILEFGDIKADIKIKKLDKKISDLIKLKKVRTIGINKDVISLNEFTNLKKVFKGTKFTDISETCKKLREAKTEKEIKIIKKACSITDRIFKECLQNFNKFKTETDILNFITYKTKEYGCKQSWTPKIASGANAAIPHYSPKGKLRKGFCIMDFGVVYKGYNSDMTRTLYIGEPSGKEIALYHLVLNTQQKVISNLKSGKRVCDIDKEARKYLGKYSKYFIHSPGHGIGVKIWELPRIGASIKDKLKENSTITIEPGIYIKGKLGIRIEDDILIKKNKGIYLTKSPKDLICIRKKEL